MSIHIRTCAGCGLKFLTASPFQADIEMEYHRNNCTAERTGSRKWWEKLRESEDGGFAGQLTVYDKIFMAGAKIGI